MNNYNVDGIFLLSVLVIWSKAFILKHLLCVLLNFILQLIVNRIIKPDIS